MSEIVERLRCLSGISPEGGTTYLRLPARKLVEEAADTIEAQAAEIARLTDEKHALRHLVKTAFHDGEESGIHIAAKQVDPRTTWANSRARAALGSSNETAAEEDGK